MMRALLVLAVLLTAPAAAEASQQSDLDAARATWAAEGFDNYRFTVQVGCFCPQEYVRPYVVHVRDGKPYQPSKYVRDHASVPQLFDLVQEAIDGRGTVEVTYAARGLPSRIDLDPIPEAIDDERSISASKLSEEDAQPPKAVDPSIQDGSALEALRAAKARWKDGGLRDYRFQLQLACFCTPETLGPSTVTVRGGKAKGDGLSVLDLFDEIRGAIRGEAAILGVKYAKSGMPRRISIDRDFRIADEEIAYRARKLRPLG